MKKKEKVVRFYGPECDNSMVRLYRHDIVLEDGTKNIEFCSVDSKDGPYTVSCKNGSNFNKSLSEIIEDGWPELDSNKEYYLVVDAWWFNSACRPFGNVELSKEDCFRSIPKQVVNLFDKDNVVSVGFWEQWGDGEVVRNILKRYKNEKFHNYGKFCDDDPVERYIYLTKNHPGTIFGPKIELIKKPEKEKTPEPQPEPEKPKVNSLVEGNLKVLDNRILSVLLEIYKGKTISVSEEKGNLKILIKDFKGKKPSQEE